MEILFENRYARNKELAKEMYRYFYFGRKIMIAIYAVMATCFACSVFLVCCGEIYSRSVLIGVPLYFAYKIYCYFAQVKAFLKRDREIHQEEIMVEMRFTDEEVHFKTSNGSSVRLSYSSIRRIKQTKNLILLFTNAKLIYVVHKHGFSQGTTEDFLAFMREKGIKA